MAKMSSDKKFKAYVYQDDYKEMRKLVQQYPNIETGGDLFGLWHDNKSVVIQLFIGPGKKCSRTTTSFHQDTDYLNKVGTIITTEEGLCNVGEWHSHHQIGMPEPSRGDKQTVLSNMPDLGLDRFVLFIASIESKPGETRKKRSRDIKLDEIKLRCFMFSRELPYEKQPIEGKIFVLEEQNPIRLGNKARSAIDEGAEEPPKHDEGPEVKRAQEKQRKSSDGGKAGSVKSRPYHPNNENLSPNIWESQNSFPRTGSAAGDQYGQLPSATEQGFQGSGQGLPQQPTSRQTQTQQHGYRNPSPQTSPQYGQAQAHQQTSGSHGNLSGQTSHQYSQSQTNVQNVSSHHAPASRQDWQHFGDRHQPRLRQQTAILAPREAQAQSSPPQTTPPWQSHPQQRSSSQTSFQHNQSVSGQHPPFFDRRQPPNAQTRQSHSQLQQSRGQRNPEQRQRQSQNQLQTKKDAPINDINGEGFF